MRAPVIYLPVEIAPRELSARVILARNLASHGYVVLVFQSDLFDSWGWPFAGVYVGKNCFRTEVPHSEVFYDRMKDRGIAICHLDEEGGVYSGSGVEQWQRRYVTRFDPAVLGSDDSILCWGKWQADVHRSRGLRCGVHVTGSPNFDVFTAPELPKFFSYDNEVTEGRGGYVLVNTRYPATNGFKPVSYYLSGETAASPLIDANSMVDIVSEQGALQWLMCRLVNQLSERCPGLHFVVRPHPAEAAGLYRTVFKHRPNVEVIKRGEAGPWIRRCRHLIHNGCTTAIQAAIAGKSVSSYLPLADASLPMALADSVGAACRNVAEVQEAMYEDKPAVVSHPDFSNTIKVGQSMEAIRHVIAEVQQPERYEVSHVCRKVASVCARRSAREAARVVASSCVKRLRARIESERRGFDPDTFKLVGRLHGLIESENESRITCRRVGSRAWIFHAF